MVNMDFRLWGEAAHQPLTLYLLQFAEAILAICHDRRDMVPWYSGHPGDETACASRVAELRQIQAPQAMQ
jgi:hypothetical protein